jgi:hypothetical protein
VKVDRTGQPTRPGRTRTPRPTWPTLFDETVAEPDGSASDGRWPALPRSDLDGGDRIDGSPGDDRDRAARLVAEQRGL